MHRVSPLDSEMSSQGPSFSPSLYLASAELIFSPVFSRVIGLIFLGVNSATLLNVEVCLSLLCASYMLPCPASFIVKFFPYRLTGQIASS